MAKKPAAPTAPPPSVIEPVAEPVAPLAADPVPETDAAVAPSALDFVAAPDAVAAPIEPTPEAVVSPGDVGSWVTYYLKDGDFDGAVKIDGAPRPALVVGIPHPALRNLRVKLEDADHTNDEIVDNGLFVNDVPVRESKSPGNCSF